MINNMKEQVSEKTEKKQKKRGAPPQYLFKPGQSGNPAGRPKGSVSITAMIKKKLQEMPPDKKKTYLEYVVEKILSKALVDGDPQMLKLIWQYVDGMPIQKVEQEMKKPFPFEIKINVLPPQKLEKLPEPKPPEVTKDERGNI